MDELSGEEITAAQNPDRKESRIHLILYAAKQAIVQYKLKIPDEIPTEIPDRCCANGESSILF